MSETYLSVGELRKALDGVPDDTRLVVFTKVNRLNAPPVKGREDAVAAFYDDVARNFEIWDSSTTSGRMKETNE